jgi:hypothetical protein
MDHVTALLPPGALTRRSANVSSGLLALVAPHAATQAMLLLAAHLAQRGPLSILDGGNRFNAYKVARLLRQIGSGAIDPFQALARIQVARAFTCFQMTAMIEAQPASPGPVLIIDLLDTFYDESASLEERHSLALRCVRHLGALSRKAPVVISLRPPCPPQADPTGLLEIIQSAADWIWVQAGPAEAPEATLF